MPLSSMRTLAVFGTGVLVGSGLSFCVCWRLLKRINRQISKCQRDLLIVGNDVQLLKDRFRIRDYSQIAQAVTSDEEDRFEEAYGGSDTDQDDTSDQLPSPAANGITNKEELFDLIDRGLQGSDAQKEEAYSILIANQARYPTNGEFWWRMAKACYLMADIAAARNNLENRKQLIYAAMNHAMSAERLDSNSADVHKWCAITLGMIGDYEGISKKIENGHQIKIHIDESIRLNDKDYSTHYMRGRWCYEVYMLSWVERKVAATIFAKPPTASLEDALAAFSEAEKLNPKTYKANMVYLAKCYYQQSNYVDAVQWLRFAQNAPIQSAEDRDNQQEIADLMKKYTAYL